MKLYTFAPAANALRVEMFNILLNRIEPHLSEKKFLLGDKFSIADTNTCKN